MVPIKPDFHNIIHDGRHVAGRFLKKMKGGMRALFLSFCQKTP
jgi:hypothetical protein